MKSKMQRKMAKTVAVTLGALAGLLTACGQNPSPVPNHEEELVSVQVLVLDGLAYPSEQFHVAPPDRCDAPHWHASRAVFAIGMDRPDFELIYCHDGPQFPQLSDPDPGGCGFGRVSQVQTRNAIVFRACWDDWLLR